MSTISNSSRPCFGTLFKSLATKIGISVSLSPTTLKEFKISINSASCAGLDTDLTLFSEGGNIFARFPSILLAFLSLQGYKILTTVFSNFQKMNCPHDSEHMLIIHSLPP